MSRYIDADAYAAEMKVRQDALKELIDDAVAMDNWEMYDGLSREFSVFVEAKLTLDAMPTVDAVPVVHGYNTKWISAKEKLPDNQRPVLVYVPESEGFCEYVGIADYTWSPKGGFWCGTDGETYGAIGFIRTPTYWCELPKPPKGEEK